jgi:hypothetical protein
LASDASAVPLLLGFQRTSWRSQGFDPIVVSLSKSAATDYHLPRCRRFVLK